MSRCDSSQKDFFSFIVSIYDSHVLLFCIPPNRMPSATKNKVSHTQKVGQRTSSKRHSQTLLQFVMLINLFSNGERFATFRDLFHLFLKLLTSHTLIVWLCDVGSIAFSWIRSFDSSSWNCKKMIIIGSSNISFTKFAVPVEAAYLATNYWEKVKNGKGKLHKKKDSMILEIPSNNFEFRNYGKIGSHHWLEFD